MKRNLPVSIFKEINKTLSPKNNNNLTQAVNARNVHEWLGVGRDFSNWIKGRIEKFGFIKNIDYVIVENLSSPNLATAKARSQIKKEYHCSPDMVKQLAMIENSEKGQQVRKYFIDCEIIASERAKELEIRSSLRVEYRPMTDAIQRDYKAPKHYHFSNENDMIYRIVTGVTASKFKQFHDINKNDSVRDFMTQRQLDAMLSLQRANTALIEMGESFQDRKQKLNLLFENRHQQDLIDEVNRINE